MTKNLLAASSALVLAACSGPTTQPDAVVSHEALDGTLNDFRDCVGPNTAGHGSSCTLPPGTYNITQPVLISRYRNITIAGPGAVIKRTTLLGSSVMVQTQPNVSSVTIRDLTFDGNKRSLRARPDAEVEVAYGRDIVFSGTTFVASKGVPLAINSHGPFTVNRVIVDGCTFRDNGDALLVTLAGGGGFSAGGYWDYRLCGPSELQRAGAPQNIGIRNSHFPAHTIGAIAFGEVFSADVTNNDFIDDPSNPDPGNGAGGTILLSPCTASVYIVGNRIDGSYARSPATGGLELDGRDLLVSQNTITNMPEAGIALQGVENAVVLNNRVDHTYRFAQPSTGGIKIQNIAPWTSGGGRPPTAIRPNGDITMAGNTVTNSYAGVAIFADAANPTITNVNIHDNCLSPNPAGPIFYWGQGGNQKPAGFAVFEWNNTSCR